MEESSLSTQTIKHWQNYSLRQDLDIDGLEITGGQTVSTSMTDKEYLAGSHNQVADMLNHITPVVNAKNEVISEVDDFVNAVIANATANLVTHDELKSKSQQDEILQRLCNFLQTDWHQQIIEELQPFHWI